MKYLKLLAITFMALMLASLTTMAHDEMGSLSSRINKDSGGSSPPAMAYSIKKTRSMTNAHCAGHANVSLKKSGFGNRKNGNNFVVGSRGGYEGTILYATSSKQAIFIVVIVKGPDFSQARKKAKKLAADFSTH